MELVWVNKIILNDNSIIKLCVHVVVTFFSVHVMSKHAWGSFHFLNCIHRS
jgi:hypothetical protein